MTEEFRLTLAQLNPVAGDIAGNIALARTAWEAGRAGGAQMVALPEMFVTGHQVRDPAGSPGFVSSAMEAVERLATETADGPALGLGAPCRQGSDLYNAYWICRGGKVATRVFKHRLTNDPVLGEKGLYDAGPISGPYGIGPLRIGTPIGEDAWSEDVAEALAESGAEILLVPAGSPYHRETHDQRMGHMVARGVETGLPVVHLNMVGGQGDRVFDGTSFVLNPGGALAHQMRFAEDEIRHVDFTRTDDGWRAVAGERLARPGEWEADYRIMAEGLRDHCAKSGVERVLLELSGDIASALVAVIAADALGPAAVRCVVLSDEDTAQSVLDDAAAMAERIGCRLDTVPFDGPRRAMAEALAPLLADRTPDPGDLRSRLRGVGLMTIADTFGERLLVTGRKSEGVMSHATPHGDMPGGYDPVQELCTARVIEICRWRNTNHRPWMKAPAGELISPGLSTVALR